MLYDALRILRILRRGSWRVRQGPRLAALPFPYLPKDFFLPKKSGRRATHLENIAVFFGDFFWFFTVGVLFAVLLYWQNDGEFRLFMLVGAAVGFALYYHTAGRLVTGVAELLSGVLHILLYYLYRLAVLPLRLLRTAAVRVCRFLHRALLQLFLPIYSSRAMRKRLRRVCRGISLSRQST